VSLLLGAAAGACVGAVLPTAAGQGKHLPPTFVVLVLAMLGALGQEILFRGVLQRAIQEHVIAARVGVWKARFTAAAASGLVGVVTAQLGSVSASSRVPVLAIAAVQVMAAIVYALTGRVAASWLAQAVAVGVAAFA
jgi:membrane protease YdiL (CAAX protease family)